jgi:predicted PurR-regulated permease PerM
VESVSMTESQKWLTLVVTLAVGFVVYLLAPVLTPFLAAALLSYLGDPLVDRMESRGLPRTAAVVVVFFLLLAIISLVLLLLVPAVGQQIEVLVSKLPSYLDWAQKNVGPWLQQKFGVDASLLDSATLKSAVQEHWSQFGGIAQNIMAWLSQSGMALVALLANLVLIPVVTFYLLRDWDALIKKIHALLPRKWEPTAVKLAKESDEVLGAFLRGQMLVMLALAFVYSMGLWWVGLELALIIGLVAGLVSFVPYLGFIIGIIFASVAAMMQFHDPSYLLLVAAVFGVGQALEGMLLTPLLVGDKIGLHPVAVIFAVMAGGTLFGFVGVLLALPMAAIVMVLLRHLQQVYRQSDLYSD